MAGAFIPAELGVPVEPPPQAMAINSPNAIIPIRQQGAGFPGAPEFRRASFLLNPEPWNITPRHVVKTSRRIRLADRQVKVQFID